MLFVLFIFLTCSFVRYLCFISPGMVLTSSFFFFFLSVVHWKLCGSVSSQSLSCKPYISLHASTYLRNNKRKRSCIFANHISTMLSIQYFFSLISCVLFHFILGSPPHTAKAYITRACQSRALISASPFFCIFLDMSPKLTHKEKLSQLDLQNTPSIMCLIYSAIG